MKQFLVILCLALSPFINAENTSQLLEHLSNVNSEWKNQSETTHITLDNLAFNNYSYHDWIATHLMLTEKILRSRSVSHLTAAQRTNRDKLLEELTAYWKAGIFPVNDYLPYKNPVFIDRKGTHCAVGYLMMKSGNDALAQKINANEKFAYVRQIKSTGVKEWADTNGFTIDELAWIQPDYVPVTQFEPVGGGTNGTVTKLNSDWNRNILSFVGNFTMLDSLPCLNVGYYQNNQLNCFGNGVEGTVSDIYTDNNGNIVITGNLIANGITHPMAVFDSVWNYVDIPGRSGAVGECGSVSEYQYTNEIVISLPSLPGQQEIWDRSTTGNWEKLATVNGRILDINYANGGRYFVGQFDSVTTHDSVANCPISAHNVIYKAYWGVGGWQKIGTDVSDIVLTSRTDGFVTYFAGTCSSSAGNHICLTRYVNGDLQPLILSDFFVSSQNSIKDILVDQGTVIVAGAFEIGPGGIGYSGKNLAMLDVATNFFMAMGTLDQTVEAVTDFRNDWFTGGSFTYSSGNSTALPHLARFFIPTGLNEISSANSLIIYPNPAAEKVSVQSLDGDFILKSEILDALGRKIFAEAESATLKEFPLNQFSPGLYILRVQTRNGWASSRFVKQ